MALYITDECINCDLCAVECPNEAISMGDDFFEIDSEKCTECIGHYEEPNCVQVCPVECILADPKKRETVDELAEKFTLLYG